MTVRDKCMYTHVASRIPPLATMARKLSIRVIQPTSSIRGMSTIVNVALDMFMDVRVLEEREMSSSGPILGMCKACSVESDRDSP